MTSQPCLLITDRLAIHAAERPDQVALRCGVEALSYERLNNRIATCAHYILSHSYAGDRIALEMPNSLELIVWFLATARTGRIAMVMDTGWTDETRRAVLERSSPALIITPQTDPHEGLKEKPHVDYVSAYADFYVGFTSGSTGLPKGFRRSHRSWVLSFIADQTEFAIGPSDRILAPGSMVHSLFLYAVINGLFAGATIDILPRFNARPMLDVIRERQITHLYVVPAMLTALQGTAMGSIPSLRSIISGGSKLSPQLRADLTGRFPLADIVEFFGASETSFIAISRTREGAPPDSVGRPFEGVSIRLVKEDGSDATIGEEGRLYIKSDLLFSGYEGDDQKRLIRDGEWISVGDRMTQDENGFLYLVGRENRLIVSSGRNITPEKIEDTLVQHPSIQACAVLGLDDPRREQELVGILELTQGHSLTASALRQNLKEQLRAYEIPHRFFIVKAMPKTSSGKIAYAELEKMQDTDWQPLD